MTTPTKYAVFDTETTGLFLYKDAATGIPIPADDPRQPRLAHLALYTLDDDLQIDRSVDLLVKPDGWEMPAEASRVNGLTTELLHDKGVPIGEVLDAYCEVVDAGYVMVAFNAQFDCKAMRAELRRAGMDDRFDRTPNICVMRAAMSLGVTKANGGSGYPKLTDCAAYLGFTIPDAHTAGGDALATVELFRHLHSVGALPEPKVHYAKVPPAHARPQKLETDLLSPASVPERF